MLSQNHTLLILLTVLLDIIYNIYKMYRLGSLAVSGFDSRGSKRKRCRTDASGGTAQVWLAANHWQRPQYSINDAVEADTPKAVDLGSSLLLFGNSRIPRLQESRPVFYYTLLESEHALTSRISKTNINIPILYSIHLLLFPLRSPYYEILFIFREQRQDYTGGFHEMVRALIEAVVVKVVTPPFERTGTSGIWSGQTLGRAWSDVRDLNCPGDFQIGEEFAHSMKRVREGCHSGSRLQASRFGV